jgi:hypothetical protein
MTWYAIRATPGSQKPEREYTVQPSLTKRGKRRGKGYRILPTINHDKSVIERALSRHGFQYYMPAEKRLIRDRRHTDLYKPRRFALMVGYVFVCDPHDFRLLEEIPEVLGIVKTGDGVPLPISILDVMMMRSMEAISEESFDKERSRAGKALRKKAKQDSRLRMLISKLDNAEDMTVPSPMEKLTGTFG